jgi:hypothetical protein
MLGWVCKTRWVGGGTPKQGGGGGVCEGEGKKILSFQKNPPIPQWGLD